MPNRSASPSICSRTSKISSQSSQASSSENGWVKWLTLVFLGDLIYLQKKTTSKWDSSINRSNIRSLTSSISSANSRFSSSINHSKTDSSFCRSPSYNNGFPFLQSRQINSGFSGKESHPPEVNKGREGLDGISLCQLRILNLHHMYSKDVTFVIDQLQSLQNLIANVAVDLV